MTVAEESEEHSKEVIEEYSNLLHLISISVAPVSIKIEALEVIALSKIVHHFSNTRFNQLNGLDTLLTKTICSILCLNHSTTVRTCFQPKWKGGLGIRKPSIVYRSTRITHLLAMLNHQEVNIRFVARNSLRLDMEKHGVRRSSKERHFLGFKCNNKGIIETNIKGGFGVASDWPHLNKLAGKLRVSHTFENIEVEELMDAGNAVLLYENGDVIRYGSNKALRKKLTLQQLETELSDIKQLKMQGTLIDLPNTDYLLSQDILRNTNWADKLVIFWFKMRHNVTSCNYTLSLWYGSSPTCALDGYRLESMAHLLNGCKEFKDVYSSRHDKIVSKLEIELGPFWNEIHVNKCVSTSLPFVSQDDLLSLKPDVVLLKDSNCVIAEVSCPYDLYVKEVYDEKKKKIRCTV